MWLEPIDSYFHLIPRDIVANSPESRIPQLHTQKTQTHSNSSSPIPLNIVILIRIFTCTQNPPIDLSLSLYEHVHGYLTPSFSR
jgi:hypothetical protein